MKVVNKLLPVIAAVSLISSCSQPKRIEVGSAQTTVIVKETVNELERDPIPGAVNEVWIEPMYDTVETPGQLDPAGVYYRKPHTALVEVRKGKVQRVEYPDYDGSYALPVQGNK